MGSDAGVLFVGGVDVDNVEISAGGAMVSLVVGGAEAVNDDSGGIDGDGDGIDGMVTVSGAGVGAGGGNGGIVDEVDAGSEMARVGLSETGRMVCVKGWITVTPPSPEVGVPEVPLMEVGSLAGIMLGGVGALLPTLGGGATLGAALAVVELSIKYIRTVPAPEARLSKATPMSGVVSPAVSFLAKPAREEMVSLSPTLMAPELASTLTFLKLPLVMMLRYWPAGIWVGSLATCAFGSRLKSERLRSAIPTTTACADGFA